MKNLGKKRLVCWFVASLVAVGVSGFVLFDAMVLEPNWISVDRVVIRNDRFSRALGEMTIAQISDLHLKGKLGFKERELIRKLNNLEPDIIVVTGDLVEEKRAVPLVTEFFSKLKPKLWSYGILGNSDRKYLKGSGYKQIWSSPAILMAGLSVFPAGGLSSMTSSAVPSLFVVSSGSGMDIFTSIGESPPKCSRSGSSVRRR